MSSLSPTEKRTLEKLLGMSSGYVHTFSNRTFQDFFTDVLAINIYDEVYSAGSGSKANRMRAFWERAPDHLVARALKALLDYDPERYDDPGLVDGARRIIDRLERSAPVTDADAIAPLSASGDFDALADSVQKAISANEPEQALDRLHTYTVKLLRTVCEGRGLKVDRDKPLHSLMGEYAKAVAAEGLLKSQMGERILKSSIANLEAFNRVRNEQSLAHDNPLLGTSEALLILNSVASTIRFIRSIEDQRARPAPPQDSADDDLPF